MLSKISLGFNQKKKSVFQEILDFDREMST